MTGLTLIIPTYNRAELLKSALSSLATMGVPNGIEWEILVIDNNCTDHTKRVVEGAKAQLPVRRVIETQQGLCFSRNRAIREARYEHLIYLDDDIIVAPTWLNGYVEAINQWNADAVVGPVSPVYPQSLPDFASRAVLSLISSPYSQKGHEARLLPRETAHEIPGCNFGVRKHVAAELGGFDPCLDRIGVGLLSGGDWEFGRRLVKAGKRVVYHPACAIQHIISERKLTRSYLRRRAFGDAISRTAIDAKHGAPVSVRRRVRMAGRSLRLFGRVFLCHFGGRAAAAMENELQACACAGTALGPTVLGRGAKNTR